MIVKNVVPLSLVLLVGILMMTFGWIGFYGSDDMSYASAGEGWLNDFPYVGDSHWTLRHTVVIPMAFFFLVGGISELALVLGTSLYFLALVTAVYAVVARHFDRATGTLAALLLATLPLMATQSTVVVPDFAEVFFCFISLVFFYEATLSDRPVRFLVLAGFAAGLSWLTRETVVFFLLTYGILFLFGFGIKRRYYFIMAASFLTIVGLEFLYFTILEGNPFYRLNVDFFTHLKIAPDSLETVVGKMARVAGAMEGESIGVLSRTGNLSVGRLVDPLLVILLNQEFMFFFYIAVPAIIWMAFFYKADTRKRTFIRVFGLAGLVWFLCLWLQIGMSLLPRYYMLPTVMVCIVFAIWIREIVWVRHSIIAIGIVGFLALNNLMGVYIDNRNPLFAERALIDFLKSTDEVVHTDTETARRGKFLYDIAGVTDRIKGAEPEKGILFFSNPNTWFEAFR